MQHPMPAELLLSAIDRSTTVQDFSVSKSGIGKPTSQLLEFPVRRRTNEPASLNIGGSLSAIIAQQTKALELATYAINALDASSEAIANSHPTDSDAVSDAKLLNLRSELKQLRRCVVQALADVASQTCNYVKRDDISEADREILRGPIDMMLSLMRNERARIHRMTGSLT